MTDSELAKLEAELKASPPDTPQHVEALNNLGWELWSTDADRAHALVKEAYEIAGRIGDDRGMAYASRGVGLLHYAAGRIEEAMRHLTPALQWFEENDDPKGLADAKTGMAYIYWGFGDFKRGFEYAEAGLALHKQIGNIEGEGWASSALGGFHHDWKDHRRSLKYHTRALEIFEEKRNHTGMGRALNGIGNAHHLLEEYDKALEYQDRSLECFTRDGNEFGASKTHNDIGLIHQSQGQHEKAIAFHRRSLDLREARGYQQGACTCLLDIANALIVLRRYDEAREYLDRALVMSEQIRSKTKQRRAHELFSQLYRDLGQFDVAFVHFENFHRITEEIFHEDSQQKLRNMKAAHEIEAAAKEAEIARLKNVELRDKNDQLENAMTELRNTQAQLLQEGKMAALGGLAAGLAHEINNPVGAIKSAADVSRRVIERVRKALGDVSEDDPKGDDLKRLIELLSLNVGNTAVASERIERIVKSFRTFTRLDEAPFLRADVREALDATLTLLEPEVPEEVEVVRDYGQLPYVYMYAGEMNQVFMNLLLNALQSMRGAGTITVRTWAEPGNVNIEFKDTGKGIPAEKLAGLFEPAFTRKYATVRMRTGLYTSRNIVRNHLGELNVTSEVGKGSAFHIRFPDELDRLLGGAESA